MVKPAFSVEYIQSLGSPRSLAVDFIDDGKGSDGCRMRWVDVNADGAIGPGDLIGHQPMACFAADDDLYSLRDVDAGDTARYGAFIDDVVRGWNSRIARFRGSSPFSCSSEADGSARIALPSELPGRYWVGSVDGKEPFSYLEEIPYKPWRRELATVAAGSYDHAIILSALRACLASR